MHADRRSHRLRGYDYRRPDPYFVTICTKNRECLFGGILDGRMRCSDAGDIVRACWDELPRHFSNVVLDAFVVMPNHVHGILWIVNGRTDIIPSVGMTHASSLRERIAYARNPSTRPMPARGPLRGSLGAMVGSFKSAVTRRIHAAHRPNVSVWQENYHERIIRTESSLRRVRRYIEMNPAKWQRDRLNPDR